jgi:hypothetical protein
VDTSKCSALVAKFVKYYGYHRHQCCLPIWKDGKCKIHHPESKKAREEKSRIRFEENRKKQPWHLLMEANKKIKELEETILSLEERIEYLEDPPGVDHYEE